MSLAAPGRDPLMATLPELVIVLRRDGVILDHNAGQGLAVSSALTSRGSQRELIGDNVAALWSAPTVTLLKQLARKAIAVRGSTEAGFEEGGQRYEARVSAQGPDRAICVIRAALDRAADALESTDVRRGLRLDRRSFLRQLNESVNMAALRETPMALAVVVLDGITDIANVIDVRLAEQVLGIAITRLPQSAAEPAWHVGQLGDSAVGLAIGCAERSTLGKWLGELSSSLREPISVGGNDFHLTPYVGVAILGEDATTPKMLLEHARRAAAEARSRGSEAVCFFTDTLQLESLARLDIARELRAAIAHRDIRLRYLGRYDLASGRQVAWVGYLHWQHPLRGEIRPAEFLRVAEATGLAVVLSRALLAGLAQDLAALGAPGDTDLRLSFGPLRHHVLQESFLADVEAALADGALPAQRLELRIAERAFLAHAPAALGALAARGVRLIVDEAGRAPSSLEPLARAPLWGLQLDRAWVSALTAQDGALALVAHKVCRATIGIAEALELTSIAPGVDSAAQRDALLLLGCRQGMGDLYASAP